MTFDAALFQDLTHAYNRQLKPRFCEILVTAAEAGVPLKAVIWALSDAFHEQFPENTSVRRDVDDAIETLIIKAERFEESYFEEIGAYKLICDCGDTPVEITECS